ncbi:adenylate/guanylate cyclase domain-containing protein [Dyadobacter sp. CY347]|uniref:adenylate/guanylate cyclase domain-containing protein n=1 Tax=Dyadobacter sp. CY347 TaxID=2909336 RepID=UPI001F1CBD38|nr:adenylate/guanylate cyclase domain-containing protein [Dyadobacter sp. CY347]MCF2489031.1 adenylate/guanylate cyclase domain-containing protein [Dyadobacter sp. CY347]
MLSPKTKRDVALVIPFGMVWFVFSLIYCILERGILGDLDHYPSTGNQYKFAANVVAIPIAGLMMGLITGILEIGYFSKWFIKKSFARKIVFKSFLYLIIATIFLVVILLMNALYTHSKHSFENLISPVWAFFTDYAAVGLMVYIASVILITQFYTEFSQSIGPGTLSNFFLGKYHHPVEEERIFMFLDMKSSTTIAENLGHVRYFEMLKEYFFDLSVAVIDFAGTIYQYAGDEMIVCWKLKEGLKNNNSIECFFAMKRALKKQEEKYISNFGILPAFKAGVHFGRVTAGEIGSLKKEIIFTGDVLNTSARIQGLCNHFDADLLVSEDLAKILTLPANYKIRSVGENLLKGRSKKMEIFAISPSEHAI